MAESGIARFELKAGGVTLQGEAELPAGPVSVEDMLPVFHGLGSALVNIAVQAVEADGHSISCRAGCGACCRQIVPITEHEARALSELVFSLPEPRRTRVLLRFRDAVLQIEAAGIRPRIEQLHLIGERSDRVRLGIDYFSLGIPCPFLEDESCSIHEVRPMACREYLVTSDPVHCQDPASLEVVGVHLPAKPSHSLSCFGEGDGHHRFVLVPLVLSLQFAAANPAPEAHVPAPEMLKRFLEFLDGRDFPESEPAAEGPSD